MAIFYNVIAFLGGLAMFLYGMQVMGDGLKRSSGGAMKRALAKVTNKPVMGFLLGALVTCVIQSSTATIVLTVGLVGAGFLTFHQSIGIVLGANVGTAITAQIIRLMDVKSGQDSIIYFFKADNLAPLALIIGIVLIMFIKRNNSQNAGHIACGFGILFMGLIYMSNIVGQFGDSMSNLLIAFENNYFLQFLAGTAVTGVVQSSSAVVGIIQSIASSIGVTFCGIFAVIIGVNIGDCLTTYIVSRIGAKPEQRRTAVVHVVYNVFAAILIILLVIIGRATGIISDELWLSRLDSGGVANLHGAFRLIPAVLLLPLTGLFEKLTCKIVKDVPVNPEDADAEDALRGLDPRLITSPRLALDEVERTVGLMADVAMHNYKACVQQIYEFEPKRDDRIQQREDLLDRIYDSLNQYIISISPYISTEHDMKEQNFELKAINAIERIGDLAVNITQSVAALRSTGKFFSEAAKKELRVAIDACYEVLTFVFDSYKNEDYNSAEKVEPLEEVIDDLIEDLNGRHVYRMVNHLCDAEKGLHYQDILANLEHISDKCSDLALYILELINPSIEGNEHQYLHDLHSSGDTEYMSNYKNNYGKYFDRLNAIPPMDAND